MRALLFETRTGLPVVDLEVSDWSYDTGVLAADKIDVSVPAYTRRARSMDLGELLTPFKYSIALVDESVEGRRWVPAAGYIASRDPQDDEDGRQSFKVSCRGFDGLMQYRHVRAFPGWPLIGSDGKPTGAYDMSFENLSLGTIIKRLVSETEKFPAGDLPIVYEPDRAGVHERTAYEALDGKPVLEAIDDIADLMDGVEYDFVPVIDEYDHVSLRLVTGLDGVGAIVGNDSLTWNLGGTATDIRGWEPNDQIGEVATDAVFTGGKGDDLVLAARATDTTLTDAGWPRVEVWDSSHSTVSRQATLQSWADGRVGGVFQRPKFEVRADKAYGLRHGDIVEISSLGHWYVPDGIQRRRVLSVNRSSSSPDWFGVSLV